MLPALKERVHEGGLGEAGSPGGCEQGFVSNVGIDREGCRVMVPPLT